MSTAIKQGLRSILTKAPDDIVLITALRTPVAKFKGSYKDTYPEELLAEILKATRLRLEKQGLDAGKVEDISTGTVLMELGGAKSGRLAALHAGCVPSLFSFSEGHRANALHSFPIETCFRTVNRQCSSSLQSLTDIAASIQTRTIDIGIAAGVEHMTRDYGVRLSFSVWRKSCKPNAQTRAIPKNISPYIKESPNQDARDCLMPMGFTSENVAAEYNIPRARQDEFAARSHQKAHAAQQAGHFDAEIVPIDVRYVDQPIEGSDEPAPTSTRHVTKDEGIRPTATKESMGKLKPAFKEDGASTAGNSSQISDGASAVTLARRDVAERLGLKPIGRFVGTSVVGVPPRIMGVGPAFAVPALLKKYGLSIGDIDVWELNEGALVYVQASLLRLDQTRSLCFASAHDHGPPQPRRGEGQPERRRHRFGVRFALTKFQSESHSSTDILLVPLVRFDANILIVVEAKYAQAVVSSALSSASSTAPTSKSASPLCAAVPVSVKRLCSVRAALSSDARPSLTAVQSPNRWYLEVEASCIMPCIRVTTRRELDLGGFVCCSTRPTRPRPIDAPQQPVSSSFFHGGRQLFYFCYLPLVYRHQALCSSTREPLRISEGLGPLRRLGRTHSRRRSISTSIGGEWHALDRRRCQGDSSLARITARSRTRGRIEEGFGAHDQRTPRHFFLSLRHQLPFLLFCRRQISRFTLCYPTSCSRTRSGAAIGQHVSEGFGRSESGGTSDGAEGVERDGLGGYSWLGRYVFEALVEGWKLAREEGNGGGVRSTFTTRQGAQDDAHTHHRDAPR